VDWGEQGLGDQIIGASMLGELTAFADHVVAEVEPRLVPLLQRSLPDVETVGVGEGLYAGRADAHVAMGDIGRYLRPSWDAFPVPAPTYLKADPARLAALHTRLHSGGAIVAGMSWRSHNIKRGRWKSAPLDELEPLLRLPGMRWIDLQYGETSEERASLPKGATLDHVDDIDNTRDLDGLAALISACDLVVTISNTTAHLAGALGKPTWVLVPDGNVRMWYWFIGRDDSPWYPHVKLRRRLMGQSWKALARGVADEIAAFVRNRAEQFPAR